MNSYASEVLDRARDRGRTVLAGFLPAGYPCLAETVAAARVLDRTGFEILELGLPYSDPVMDGQVIQAASAQALEQGFRTEQIFEAAAEISSTTSLSVLVMSYYNPLLQFGLERFAQRLYATGARGIITPDITLESADSWLEISRDTGLERVFLASELSDQKRLEALAKASTGFVYATSLMGVTGARQALSESAKRLVSRVRRAGALRVGVGIGISTPEQVRELGVFSDAAIAGSALVAKLKNLDEFEALAARLAQGRLTP